MKANLELRLAVPTTIVISLLLVVSVISDVWLQKQQTEEMLFEQAYILSQEMQSVWDFISVNQNTINTDGDGTFTFKGLHCSIVGTSVGALFTNRTDYVIRYVSEYPRNPKNSPDSFESGAINEFKGNPEMIEYASFGTMPDGEDYYRYSVPLRMQSACADCHGSPVGEIDVTGFPKEGLKDGDLVGIASISIPVKAYEENLRGQIVQRAFLSFVVLAACLLTIVLVTKRYVIRPLGSVASAVRKIGSGDLDTRIEIDPATAKGEIRTLSTHVNDMADELESLHKDLENLVEVRTEQLAEANEKLIVQARELETVNEQLRENDLYKSHFFTMMSHELRTPITAIRAYIDMLDDTSALDERARSSAVEAIKTNIHALSKLVDNILDSARIEAGAATLEKGVADVADIMNELSRSLGPLAVDKGIDLEIAHDGEVPLFMTDEDKLLHILENLGSNAIKYTDQGGHVQVNACLSDNGVIQFEVIDDGAGISEEDQKVIFDKFIQGKSFVARPVSGSGLGLALAREYAELLGGDILMRSELGSGSVFTVILPFEEPDFDLD
ncbi:DUF3365 domain-containing protein [Adlercreutzia sp. R25]|uniref:sensor histidine kinase n=1 Tax=Adlercreutzia shanghongiae TaxID=3111773 RepID=UPI002DBB829A|nr:DUF3365 domain-containing protein [Adlercreutzia sp. R25]MEC4272032.1 DUF3365 domain-containing protein [Adlercreutzia sp. R25]